MPSVIKVIASGGVLTPGTSPDQTQMTLDELQAAGEKLVIRAFLEADSSTPCLRN